MVSLTENEARAIEFLVRNFSRDYSINQLAKEIGVSPPGILKILRKLRDLGFLVEKKVGNNVIYKVNFESAEALDACKFALMEMKAGPYIRALIKDIEVLRGDTEMAILFGSVLQKGREAGDIDLLLVFDKSKLKDIEKNLEGLNKVRPKKIHAIYQTEEDLVGNIKKQDKALLEEIRTGIVFWGRDVLVEAIKDGQS